MKLELRHIRCFVCVAKHLHFARAAEELDIAPPSLTKQIQEIERLLSVRLFHRTKRSVALTAAGEAYLPEALAALAHLSRGHELAALAGAPVTPLLSCPPVQRRSVVQPRDKQGHVRLIAVEGRDTMEDSIDLVLGFRFSYPFSVDDFTLSWDRWECDRSVINALLVNTEGEGWFGLVRSV